MAHTNIFAAAYNVSLRVAGRTENEPISVLLYLLEGSSSRGSDEVLLVCPKKTLKKQDFGEIVAVILVKLSRVQIKCISPGNYLIDLLLALSNRPLEGTFVSILGNFF